MKISSEIVDDMSLPSTHILNFGFNILLPW